ncbi:MAG: hypothetical protein A2516_00340 [Alphaproteobacteria bacterium RIFOXYD12_FULL_60_8]|nr:MAG: hypothetical protein A2516_00340 [Alphaproteobacteria bacterium RIFOXYD12_FULL_60_8]
MPALVIATALLPPYAMGAKVAAAYVGVSLNTFLREVDSGRAPRPIKLTEGRKVWRRNDLEAWVDAKAGIRPSSVERWTVIPGALGGEIDAHPDD